MSLFSMPTITISQPTSKLVFYANMFSKDYVLTDKMRKDVGNDVVAFRTFALMAKLYDPSLKTDEEVDDLAMVAIVESFDGVDFSDASNVMCTECGGVIGSTIPLKDGEDADSRDPGDRGYSGVVLHQCLSIGLDGPVHTDCVLEGGVGFRRLLTQVLAARLRLEDDDAYSDLEGIVEDEIDGYGDGDYENFLGECRRVGVPDDIVDLSVLYQPPMSTKRARVDDSDSDDSDSDDNESSPAKRAKK